MTTPIESLIKYEMAPTKSAKLEAMIATLFFAGQRFRAEMLVPRGVGVDCEGQIRKSLEGMVLVGLATWTEMEDDSLEKGHEQEEGANAPISRPKPSDRISRSGRSEPISRPLPSEPIQQDKRTG